MDPNGQRNPNCRDSDHRDQTRRRQFHATVLSEIGQETRASTRWYITAMSRQAVEMTRGGLVRRLVGEGGIMRLNFRMKALRFSEFGPPSLLKIEDVPMPEPGPDRISYSSRSRCH